jgi:hypothetical protein
MAVPLSSRRGEPGALAGQLSGDVRCVELMFLRLLGTCVVVGRDEVDGTVRG